MRKNRRETITLKFLLEILVIISWPLILRVTSSSFERLDIDPVPLDATQSWKLYFSDQVFPPSSSFTFRYIYFVFLIVLLIVLPLLAGLTLNCCFENSYRYSCGMFFFFCNIHISSRR